MFYIITGLILLGLVGLIVWLVLKKQKPGSSGSSGSTGLVSQPFQTTTPKAQTTTPKAQTTTPKSTAPQTTTSNTTTSQTISTPSTTTATPSLVPDSENYGVIQNEGLSCLQVSDKRNGSIVTKGTCTGDATQLFKFDDDQRIRNMFSGKCLNVPLTPPANMWSSPTIQEGVELTQWDCSTGNEQSNGAQKWGVDTFNRFHPIVYSSYENRASPYLTRCLTLDEFGGKNVVVDGCPVPTNVLEPHTSDVWYPRNYTFLRSRLLELDEGGYCAENPSTILKWITNTSGGTIAAPVSQTVVSDVGPEIGAEIKMNQCSTIANQYFKLDSRGRIINLRDGRCLSAKSDLLSNGTHIVNGDCNDLITTQFWNYDSETKHITSEVNPTKCLTVKDAKTQVGTNLIVSDCKDGEDQKWELDY
jgi:hypothetical protein